MNFMNEYYTKYPGHELQVRVHWYSTMNCPCTYEYTVNNTITVKPL